MTRLWSSATHSTTGYHKMCCAQPYGCNCEFKTFCFRCSTYSLSVLNTVYFPAFRWHTRTDSCCMRLFLSVLFNDAVSYWDYIAFAINEWVRTNWRNDTDRVIGRKPAPLSLCPLCGFESRWGHGCLSLVSVVCCQVEVSATGRSLIQRSPTDWCVWVWSWSLDSEKA